MNRVQLYCSLSKTLAHCALRSMKSSSRESHSHLNFLLKHISKKQIEVHFIEACLRANTKMCNQIFFDEFRITLRKNLFHKFILTQTKLQLKSLLSSNGENILKWKNATGESNRQAMSVNVDFKCSFIYVWIFRRSCSSQGYVMHNTTVKSKHK